MARTARTYGGFATYEEYLNGPHWRRLRAHFLAGNRCYACRDLKKLQIHHVSYRNLGAEKARDFIVLCETCHKKVHDALLLKYPLLSRGGSANKTEEVFGDLFGLAVDASRDHAGHWGRCKTFYAKPKSQPIKDAWKAGRKLRKKKQKVAKQQAKALRKAGVGVGPRRRKGPLIPRCKRCGIETFLTLGNSPVCRTCQPSLRPQGNWRRIKKRRKSKQNTPQADSGRSSAGPGSRENVDQASPNSSRNSREVPSPQPNRAEAGK